MTCAVSAHRLHVDNFNDDRKDAGEIGAGHTVTALYEIVPPGVGIATSSVDPLKYQTPPQRSAAATDAELLTIKVRYKAPDAEQSQLLSTVVRNVPLR